MTQMGWEEGTGLGKDKQGMKSHICVKQRKDNSGIGTDEQKKAAANWTVNTHIFDSMLVKGLDGRTLCLRIPTKGNGDGASGTNIVALLSARTGIPSHSIRLVTGTAVVHPNSLLTAEDGRFPSCSLLLRLPGGTKAKDDRVSEFQDPDNYSARKRKLDGDALENLLDERDPPRAIKKARFPKGKKDSGAKTFLKDPVEGEEEGGPILATDPRLAAKERALQRTVLNEQIIDAEDVSLVDDTVAAEEKNAMARLEDGITIEPFNLNQEREEGYFDAQGNYVEYRLNEDDKDAWFETAEVDESLQAKKIKEKEMAKEDTELTTEDRWVLQKRIANTLLPGETILQAFRRLRGVTKDKKWAPPMVGETKQIFDRLTEDAMKLLDNGDYNIYNEDKETLQREADGYEALARARKGETSGSNGTSQHSSQVQSTAGDMFGDDDSFDIFGGDDNVPSSTTSVNLQSQPEQSSNTIPELPGYVYDASSGYYYNADDGYFYDKNSGLFCNAASGKWFMYDGANGSYQEVSESGDNGGSMTSVGAEA